MKARRHAATNAGLIELQIDYRDVQELILDARNPRQHSKKQISQIADSIREFGFVMPVVVDHSNRVVIGQGRVLAAKRLGMTKVPVIELHHLSTAQLKALRVADNKLALNATWDEQLLAESFLQIRELDRELDLGLTGFALAEIEVVLDGLHGTRAEVEPEDASTGVPVCRAGELWQCGDHLLLCGDATSEASFEALMKEKPAGMVFTAPPRNFKIDGAVPAAGKTQHGNSSKARAGCCVKRSGSF